MIEMIAVFTDETIMEEKPEISITETSTQDPMDTFFQLITEPNDVSKDKKLIILQLYGFADKIKNNPELQIKYEQWQEQDTPEPKKKSPFRRKPSTEKRNWDVPMIPLGNLVGNFGTKHALYSSPSSSPKTSPASDSSSSSTPPLRGSPLRRANRKSAKGYSASDPLPATTTLDDKKNENFKFIRNILKKADSSPRFFMPVTNESQNLPKFPLDATVTKEYLKEAEAEAKNIGTALRIVCKNERYEMLINSVDSSKSSKIKVILLDKNAFVGQGDSAEIFQAWNLETEQLLIAKVYKFQTGDKVIQNEIQNLTLKNRFQGYFTGSNRILIMNHSYHDNLLSFLYEMTSLGKNKDPIFIKKKHIAPFCALQIVYKLLEEIQDFHTTPFPDQKEMEGLLHRDIKPANIQLDISNTSDIKVQLIDIADALPNRKDGKNLNTLYGSPGHHAPEQIGDHKTRKSYTKASDYYQTGITIATIISKANFYHDMTVLMNKKQAEHLEKNQNDHFVGVYQDLPDLDCVKQLMPDVYGSEPYHIELKIAVDSIEQSIHEILYKHIIFPILCELTVSLTSIDPAHRLMNSSIQEKIDDLKLLHTKCIKISKNLHDYIVSVLCLHKSYLEFPDNSKEVQFDDLWETPIPTANGITIQKAINKLINTLIDQAYKTLPKDLNQDRGLFL